MSNPESFNEVEEGEPCFDLSVTEVMALYCMLFTQKLITVPPEAYMDSLERMEAPAAHRNAVRMGIEICSKLESDMRSFLVEITGEENVIDVEKRIIKEVSLPRLKLR